MTILHIMRIQILFCLLATLLVDSCCNPEDPSKLFAIQLEGKKKQFQNGDTVSIAIKNRKGKAIGQTTYFLDGEMLDLNNGKILISSSTLGSKILSAKIQYDDTTVEIKKNIQI